MFRKEKWWNIGVRAAQFRKQCVVLKRNKGIGATDNTKSIMALLLTARLMVWSILFQQIMGSPSFTPPEGNSLKMKLKTYNGKYTYKCEKGQWIPLLATAELVNVSDYKQKLGQYSLVYRRSNPEFGGIWYLSNGPADSAESGTPVSMVAGKQVASEPSDGGIPQILAEASYHSKYGIGSRVSYIQRLYTKGGLLPIASPRCTQTIRSVDFQAEFWFYTQDMLPPAVPSAIAVPSGRMVMGFFCKGVTVYKYHGNAWQTTNIHGKLYDVPGGIYVGNYYLTSKTDKYGGNFCLETNNPYAWSVIAKIDASSIQVSKDSIPWSLFKITSSTGNTSILGPFNYFQMIGTRGGLPPSPTSNGTTPKGSVYNSVFTNLFWIFSPLDRQS